MDKAKFSDVDEMSACALEGTSALLNSGIMNGTSATTLSPQAPCTVEQAILLCYRLYQQTQG